MADPRLKQIKIKTGVVKRLTKEKESYEKEALQLEEKVEKMKADGKDEYDIKKQGEVLQESRSMVPDTIRRLKKAYAELDEILEKESDLSEAEEYTQAKEILKLAEPIIS
ncbi:tubulin-specific chaperone a [Plakobranchus ocellatus]|uniref:Tubulin-specific chaperone A n=1 Tax=Plakobranchus ocellatus TaxID=259542 RepID=A0AAV4CQQ1_9GAST|nr:tubulin-specific chaperone a [Plakobranchus ocellatus]